MKKCAKCAETKPNDAFYRYVRNRDGLASYCKVCSAEVSRAWQKTERGKAYSREHARSEKTKASRRRLYAKKISTVEGRLRKWANEAVNYAVRTGKLVPVKTLFCDCGKQAAHYHHDSYAEEDWLKVTAVCRACHGELHRSEVEV